MATTSGTYSFDPGNDDHIAEAFSRLQIRGDEIDADKITDAERSANLMMVEWNNKGQNQFQLGLYVNPLTTVPNVQTTGQVPSTFFGPAPLQVFSSLVVVAAAPGAPLSGFSIPQIRIARADYEQIPYKTDQGRPDRYFWDTSGLTISSNYMQLWPCPDSPSTYTLRTWVFQRIQDAGNLSNLAPIKYEWLEAFDAGLTARLAEKYKPDQFQAKTLLANAAWMAAVSGGRERGPTRFRVDGRSATSWR